MLDLLLAVGLALGLAYPQLARTWEYLPKSIRYRVGYEGKVRLGSIPLKRLLLGLVAQRLRDRPGGVFFPEAATYIGWVGLLGLLWAPWKAGWAPIVLFSLLAMGKHTPLWKLVHPLMLRVPARWCYFLSATLAILSTLGLSTLPVDNLLKLLVILQCWDLCMNTSSLWPMQPFTQRWEKPSQSFNKPYLSLFKEPWRVSGLPFPIRTGHVTHTRTLGYTGGAQLQAMAWFRRDTNPDGSGLHTWSGTQKEADWYGVRWAITHRPLKPPWIPTQFSHVYENSSVTEHPPTWKELEELYGPR